MTLTLAVLLGAGLLLIAGLVVRRRSVMGRQGVFKGKLRVVEGEVEGLSSRWTAGYGYWVRDVLVWNKGPLLFLTTLVPVEGADASGVHTGTVSGLGRRPVVAPLLSDRRSRLELATAEEDRDLALRPFARTSAVGSLVRARSAAGAEAWPDN